ncbi:MAG: hypothetical protein P4M07_09270 [Xanthobacteraceae bacterium]|nr:hypothetical protein [Xanthobacteraceae bacterium]
MVDQTNTRHDAVDADRRSTLAAMAKVMAYVPPAIATFAMGGMSARAVQAYVTNIPA